MDISVEGINWCVKANQNISEDDFVKIYINEDGIMPHLESVDKEKALRLSHQLMNPKKAKPKEVKPEEVKPEIQA